jgi:hypothetical protein
LISESSAPAASRYVWFALFVLLVGGGCAVSWFLTQPAIEVPEEPAKLSYKPRHLSDSIGYTTVVGGMQSWSKDASLDEVARSWRALGVRLRTQIDQELARPQMLLEARIQNLAAKAGLLNYDGKPDEAYAVLEEARRVAEGNEVVAERWLYSVIYLQGVTAMRRGENDNCVL